MTRRGGLLMCLGFAACASAMAALLKVTGPTLGMFIGGLGLLAIIIPILATTDDSLSISFAAALGVTGVWVTYLGEPGAWNLLSASACCFSFTFAIVGMGRLLMAIGTGATVASAVTQLVTIAWLSWPIWLSEWLNELSHAIGTMVLLHPVFAINGSIESLSPWAELPWMYRMTSLGQDAPYRMPRHVWPSVLLHVAIGCATELARWSVLRLRVELLE